MCPSRRDKITQGLFLCLLAIFDLPALHRHGQPRPSADSLARGATEVSGLANPPKPGVSIEHDHCSISQLSRIGFTISPWNFTLPSRFRDSRVSVGTTLAKGFPRLVMMSGWRVRATVSRSARQWALNSPAGIVLGCVLMVKSYDHD